MARLSKRVWENSSLTRRTKILVYQACVLTTLLYGSEAWTTYMRQEHRLNAFHMRCLRRILGISWQDHIPNRDVLVRAGVSSMHSLLSQRRLRWLGHLQRMDDGRLPKDILYGQLARGKRRPGGPKLRFTDVCRRDLRACNIPLADWAKLAEDRGAWRYSIHRGMEIADEARGRHAAEKRAQKIPTSNTSTVWNAQYACSTCCRDCRSRIPLFSH